jgi:hypothetical protein
MLRVCPLVTAVCFCVAFRSLWTLGRTKLFMKDVAMSILDNKLRTVVSTRIQTWFRARHRRRWSVVARDSSCLCTAAVVASNRGDLSAALYDAGSC